MEARARTHPASSTHLPLFKATIWQEKSNGGSIEHAPARARGAHPSKNPDPRIAQPASRSQPLRCPEHARAAGHGAPCAAALSLCAAEVGGAETSCAAPSARFFCLRSRRRHERCCVLLPIPRAVVHGARRARPPLSGRRLRARCRPGPGRPHTCCCWHAARPTAVLCLRLRSGRPGGGGRRLDRHARARCCRS